jgi:hypothetical protein
MGKPKNLSTNSAYLAGSLEISQVLMVSDSYGFVGDISGFQTDRKVVEDSRYPTISIMQNMLEESGISITDRIVICHESVPHLSYC